MLLANDNTGPKEMPERRDLWFLCYNPRDKGLMLARNQKQAEVEVVLHTVTRPQSSLPQNGRSYFPLKEKQEKSTTRCTILNSWLFSLALCFIPKRGGKDPMKIKIQINILPSFLNCESVMLAPAAQPLTIHIQLSSSSRRPTCNWSQLQPFWHILIASNDLSAVNSHAAIVLNKGISCHFSLWKIC